MVDELTSGTSIAIEIRVPRDSHASFREFCGPHDPVIYKFIHVPLNFRIIVSRARFRAYNGKYFEN